MLAIATSSLLVSLTQVRYRLLISHVYVSFSTTAGAYIDAIQKEKTIINRTTNNIEIDKLLHDSSAL